MSKGKASAVLIGSLELKMKAIEFRGIRDLGGRS